MRTLLRSDAVEPASAPAVAAADPGAAGMLSESLAAEERKPGVTAALYLHLHAMRFARAAADRLAAIEPRLPEGATWVDYPRFARSVVARLLTRLDADVAGAAALRDLTHPDDLLAAVDGARLMLGFDRQGAARHPGDPRYGLLGVREWSDAAGRAFAFAVEGALRWSVARLALRDVETQPIDRLVAPALRLDGVIDGRRATAPRRKLDARRFVWHGSWLRPAEPDATADEVADALWGDPSYAYRLTAMPPFFGAPRGGGADALAFAGSALADEAALAQAGGAAAEEATPAELGDLVAAMNASLSVIEPFAAGELAAARAFVAAKGRLAAADPAQARLWGAALRAQRQVLYEVATQLTAMQQQHAEAGDVAAAYVRAAAISHLAATAGAQLRVARERQRLLIGRIVEEAARAADRNAEDLRAATGAGDPRAATVVAAAERVQADLLAGRAPGADDVDETLVTADEIALTAHLGALGARLGLVAEQAEAANDGVMAKLANVFHGEMWSLSSKAAVLRARLATIRAHLDGNLADARLIALGEPDQAKLLREGRRRSVAGARGELAALSREGTVEQFLDRAYAEIKDARLRAVILEIGVMIGVSVASAGFGSAATAAARGLLVARSAEAVAGAVELSRGALLATRVVGLGLESTINTAAQAAVMDRPVGDTFLADFLGNLATSGLLHGLHAGADAAHAADEAVRAFWKPGAGRLVLAKGVQLTGETILGAAAGYVVERALHAGKLEPKTVTAWYLEGAAIAVGRFLHGAASRQLARLQTLAAVKGYRLGRGLSDEARALEAAAARLESDPTNHGAALDLMRMRGELLRKEQLVLEDLAANPALAQQLEGGLEAMLHENAAGRAELSSPAMRRTVLERAGLSPVAGDGVWSGSRAQLAQAVGDARRAGLLAESTRVSDELEVVRFGDAELHVFVHDGLAPAQPHDNVRAEPEHEPSPSPDFVLTPLRGNHLGDGDGPKGRKLPEYPIAKETITVEEDQTEPDELLFYFAGRTENGAPISLGSATVHLKNGAPDPQNPPSLDLGASTLHRGKLHAVKIYEGVKPMPGGAPPAPVGERTSLTAVALDKLLGAYKQRFGHEPDALEGYLSESNRFIFQKEYVLARRRKLSHDEAKVEAAKLTPFGIHRLERKYTDVHVDAEGMHEVVDLGELGTHTVPASVTVTMRRPK